MKLTHLVLCWGLPFRAVRKHWGNFTVIFTVTNRNKIVEAYRKESNQSIMHVVFVLYSATQIGHIPREARPLEVHDALESLH
jgi:uncharacterized PurR-regulated membrane protein YhhQ (DUF165 family)